MDFVCDQCDRTFAKRAQLAQHIKAIHLGLKHVCEACERQFTLAYLIVVHARL